MFSTNPNLSSVKCIRMRSILMQVRRVFLSTLLLWSYRENVSWVIAFLGSDGSHKNAKRR